MGFIWSQPESPLKASLLEEEPELILHTGDILLVPTSDIEIVLNCDPWIKVAVVVRKDKMMFAFCNGQYENISFFLQQYPYTVCRPLTCIREIGFDRRVLRAAERTIDILSKKRSFTSPLFREGFCVGTLFSIMGLVELQENLKPLHFSVESSQLELKEHSPEQFIIVY